MIYISTGGFYDLTAKEAVAYLNQEDIHFIELSGGRYDNSFLQWITQYGICRNNFAIHNYFPPPKVPFVLNIASLDSNIIERSMHHIKGSIELASRIGSDYYSIHAGYLVDPKVDELGKRIKERIINRRDHAMDVFLSNLKYLSDFACSAGVKLLVENNVISEGNFNAFGMDPLLMTHPEECRYVWENTPDNIALLVDVGHLNVSANTLGFDRVKALDNLKRMTQGYHLSENNGKEDENLSVSQDSWFWSALDKGVDYISIEVYNQNAKSLRSQLGLVRELMS